MPPGCGISAAFYYPADSQVSPYYYLGQANPSAAMSEQTIVCVGSITKTFTASLLACHTRDIQDAADIKSTAADMYTWMEANLTAPLASSPSVLQQALVMATNVQLPKPQKPKRGYCDFDMGLAWQIYDQDASDGTRPTVGLAELAEFSNRGHAVV